MLLKMTDAEYSSAQGVRKSQLDKIAISPAVAKANKTFDSEALIMGSLVHCLVLEPHRFEHEYFIMPKVDLRTKAGKEAQEEYISLAQGKLVIQSSDFEQAVEMRDSVMNVIGDLVEHPDAIIEHAIFWEDQETGVKCKCKPDIYIPSMGVAIDLKTTAGYATADDFGKSVKAFRYHVQQAFYWQGLRANSLDIDTFLFVPVSKRAGADCRAFTLDQSVVDLGERLTRKDINLWALCEQSDIWERKPTAIETIKFKPWDMTDDNE